MRWGLVIGWLHTGSWNTHETWITWEWTRLGNKPVCEYTHTQNNRLKWTSVSVTLRCVSVNLSTLFEFTLCRLSTRLQELPAALHSGSNVPQGGITFSWYQAYLFTLCQLAHTHRTVSSWSTERSTDKSSLYPAYLTEDKMRSAAGWKWDVAIKYVFKRRWCFFISSNDGLYRAWNSPNPENRLRVWLSAFKRKKSVQSE